MHAPTRHDPICDFVCGAVCARVAMPYMPASDTSMHATFAVSRCCAERGDTIGERTRSKKCRCGLSRWRGGVGRSERSAGPQPGERASRVSGTFALQVHPFSGCTDTVQHAKAQCPNETSGLPPARVTVIAHDRMSSCLCGVGYCTQPSRGVHLGGPKSTGSRACAMLRKGTSGSRVTPSHRLQHGGTHGRRGLEPP
jgi:hypothetical protein